MRDAVATLFRAGRRAAARRLAAALLAVACGARRLRRRRSRRAARLRWPAATGATVAFELIDGPPPQVFDRMVDVLDSESKLRNLSIVSREGRPPTACAAISPPRSAAAAP